jgi:hypothetical protein
MKDKLDFLLIGAGKSGTNTIFQYLKRNPKIFIPEEKELPFFNKDATKEDYKRFIITHYNFSSNGVLIGKLTPTYMGDERIPERIYLLDPKIRLICILRNPIDRSFSYYRMLKLSSKNLKGFDSLVDWQINNADIVRENLQNYKPSETFLIRSEYGRILSNYLRFFTKEQLLIVFTEELERSPESVIDKILLHIGLQQGFRPSNLGRRYFQGGKIRFPKLLPFIRKVKALRTIYHFFPKQQRIRLIKWYQKEFNISATIEFIDEKARSELKDFFNEDVMQLKKIIGVEIPWKDFQ